MQKDTDERPAGEPRTPANDTAPEADAPGSTGQQAESGWQRAADSAEGERVAALEAEVAQLKDERLRALAEAENARRRAQRDREEASRYGAAGLARDMLGVADNLRRAIGAVTPEARSADPALETLVTGVELVERELLSAFERHRIRKVEPQGEKFDANLHQAMFEVENTGQAAGTVVQVLTPGYTINGRLLRPAMVGVAKGQPEEQVERVENKA